MHTELVFIGLLQEPWGVWELGRCELVRIPQPGQDPCPALSSVSSQPRGQRTGVLLHSGHISCVLPWSSLRWEPEEGTENICQNIYQQIIFFLERVKLVFDGLVRQLQGLEKPASPAFKYSFQLLEVHYCLPPPFPVFVCAVKTSLIRSVLLGDRTLFSWAKKIHC